MEAADHSGLPEAYIETAEFDCLRDGGIKYYNKLIAGGTKAENIQSANKTAATIAATTILIFFILLSIFSFSVK